MIAGALRLLAKLLFRVHIRGTSNIPQREKILIVANHESFLDGLLIGLFLPFRATFVIHTSVLDNWLFRQIFHFVPYLAVDPTSPMGIKKIIRLLESGEPVVIFPEGRITLTGSLMKIYDGPGFVAAKTGAKILPIHVEGPAYSYFSRTPSEYPRRLFPKVTLTILPPTNIPMPDSQSAKERRRLAGEAMRRVMQEMLFGSRTETTLFGAFLDAIDMHGRKTRLAEDINQVEERYADLLKKSLALGRLATKISVPQEVVGVLMPNVNNTICLVFGMSAMQRIPAMLNYTSGIQGMSNACIAAGIKTVLSSRKFLETADLTEIVAAIPNIRLVYLEDLRSQFSLWDKLWLVAYALPFPHLVEGSSDPHGVAAVLFTSGSEGKPKSVVLAHSALLANVAQLRAVIDFSPADKFFIALPLFHAFGFTGSILPLVIGSRLFLYPSPLHYKVIPEIIYDRGCTVLFGTSTFLGNYAKYAHPYDFYKLRYVLAGAEKLNEEVRKTWMDKFGIRILEGYGTTECSPALAVNTPMANRPGSVGAALPGMQCKLENVPGIERGGLLYVKGPNLMLGYYLYDNPAVLQPPNAEIGEGWYNTGDIVEIDADRFIHILGRVKRFAKVAGEMVSLETVEQIANHASPGHQHAAVALSDAQRGENILLFTTDPGLGRDGLQASARELGSPEIAIARKIISIEDVPLLGTGKTDYVTLKQMAESAS
jgi:acyl-[acyl-carrier-protein]-phospholipid O-acyltransferase / long-chain-fatty-acid--[acyl-carrier-protein] ligase